MALFTFVQADNTTLQTIHPNWVESTTGDARTKSGVLQSYTSGSSAFTNRRAWFVNGQGDIQSSQALIKAGPIASGENRYICTQMSGSNQYHAAVSGVNIGIYRNGTFVNSGAHGVSNVTTTDYTVKLESNATTGVVNCYVNGSLKVSITDGSPLTGGYPGFDLYDAGTFGSTQIDNWTDGVSTYTKLASDNFTRANNASLGSYWTKSIENGTIGFNIASNVAISPDVFSDSSEVFSSVVWPANQYSEVTIGATYNTGNDVEGSGPTCRESASAQTYYRLTGQGAGWALYRAVAGSFTQLGTGTGTTFAAGDKLRLEVKTNGANCDWVCKKNGVQFASGTDTSPIASGSPGIGYSSTTTQAQSALSAWEGGTLDAVVLKVEDVGLGSNTIPTLLTAFEATDWAVWNGSTGATPTDKKSAGGSTISVATYGGGAFTNGGTAGFNLQWEGDGTNTSSSNLTNCAGQTLGVGSGFEFTFPADTTPREARVYMGGYSSDTKVTTIISDGSSPNQINAALVGAAATLRGGCIVVNYVAASAGQTLTIRIETTAVYTSGALTFQGATVRTIPTGQVTYIDSGVMTTSSPLSAFNVTLPLGYLPGDLLLATVAQDINSTGNWTFTGWTPVSGGDNAISTPDSESLTAFYRYATGSDPVSAVSTSNSNAAFTVAAYRGVDQTTPIRSGQFSYSSSNASNADPISISATGVTPVAGDAVVAIFSMDMVTISDGWSLTAPTGMTHRNTINSHSWLDTHQFSKNNAASGATGAITSTATHEAGSANAGWQVYVIALAAASVGFSTSGALVGPGALVSGAALNGIPTFTVQPTSQVAAQGSTATFTGTVTGATSYQWYVDKGQGTGFETVSGATSTSYVTDTLFRALHAGWLYKLYATNANGTRQSNVALLQVTDIPTSFSGGGFVVGASYIGDGQIGAVDEPMHSSAGPLLGPGALVAGSAARVAGGGGAVTHATTGALVGQGSTVAGTAARFRAMATSGALVGQGSLVTSSAARFRAHATSGALVGQGSTVAGSAARFRAMATSGALVGAGSIISSGVRVTEVFTGSAGALSGVWTQQTTTTINKNGSGLGTQSALDVPYSPSAIRNDVIFPADQYAQVEFRSGVFGAAYVNLGVRGTGTTDATYGGYFAYTSGDATSGETGLSAIVGGITVETITTYSQAWTAGDIMRLEVKGQGSGIKLQLFRNNVALGSPVTPSTIINIAGSPTVSSYLGTGSVFPTFDNWEGGSLGGIAARFRAMATSGALVGQGSLVTGSAVYNAKHTTTGTLVGQGSLVTGSAARFRAMATSGALVGQGSLVTGSAARFRAMATSGALVGQGSLVTGSATRTAAGGGPVTHVTTGDLLGSSSLVAGSAVYNAKHTTTGALVGQGSLITGSAARFRAMATSGALVGQGSLITGSAVYNAKHTTTGALVGQGSLITGSAARFRAMATSGVLVGQGSLVTGSAVYNAKHTTTGALVGQGSLITGSAIRAGAAPNHVTTGSLIGQDSLITGSAVYNAKHTTTGVLVGQGSLVTGSAARFRAHDGLGNLIGQSSLVTGSATRFRAFASSGNLVGAGSLVSGSAIHRLLHTTTAILVGAGSLISGLSNRVRIFSSSGILLGVGSIVTGLANHPFNIKDYFGEVFIRDDIVNYYYQNTLADTYATSAKVEYYYITVDTQSTPTKVDLQYYYRTENTPIFITNSV